MGVPLVFFSFFFPAVAGRAPWGRVFFFFSPQLMLGWVFVGTADKAVESFMTPSLRLESASIECAYVLLRSTDPLRR